MNERIRISQYKHNQPGVRGKKKRETGAPGRQNSEKLPASISSSITPLMPQSDLCLPRILGNLAYGQLIQARLKIGPADDPYEQEADWVAEQVMRMPEPLLPAAVTGSFPGIQRKCAACAGGGGLCPQCAEEDEQLRRKPLHAPHLKGIGGMLQRQKIEEEEEENETSLTQYDRGETLPYREATELLECIRIMGEENSAYCRQAVLGEAPAQTSGSIPGVSPIFTIILEDVNIVRPWREVESTISQALGPLARSAGRELRFGRRAPGDLTLTFDPGGHESRPCGLLILGNEGGGDIFVGAHQDLRVCGGPVRDPRNPSEIDYVSQLEHVFEPDEPEFGHFVGSTAVHELGHMMVQLPHTSDPDNFMFSSGRTGANLPKNRRTRQSMRFHWAGQKSFSAGQANQLVHAIRTGQFTGGMQISNPLP